MSRPGRLRRATARVPMFPMVLMAIAALVTAAAVVVARPAPPVAAAAPGVLKPGAGGFVSITPFRLVDTRSPAAAPTTGPTVAYAGPRFKDGEVDTFQVFVPTDPTLPPGGVGAVVVNLTAVSANDPGFLTVWPADQPQPLASVLNYGGGEIVANAVTVALSADLRFSVYAKRAVDVVIDVMGIYAAAPSGPAGGGFAGVQPTRLLDTRPSSAVGTVQATTDTDGRMTLAGLAVAGGAVPATAKAVVLNVAAVPEPNGASGAGYVTAFPAGINPPTASNLNYAGRDAVANQITVKIGKDGKVSFLTKTPVDLVVDLMGYYAAGNPAPGGFVPLDPTRFADTRKPDAGGYVTDPSTTSIIVPIVSRSTIPANAESVSANITAVDPDAAGFVTAWPDGLSRPTASNLNYVGGQTVPNAVTVGVGSTGSLELYSKATADLVVDVNGWFTSPYQ